MSKSIQERLKRLETSLRCLCNSSGGSQTLAQTLVFGNETGGENIFVDNGDAIELDNTSLLKKGTYDFGGNGGISRICSNNYEDMWQNGFRHVFDQSGFIRQSSNCFNVIPDSSFDDTLRFAVGSFWTLDDGTTYICTDNTTGAAVWDLYNVGSIPTLQNILDFNHNLIDSNNFQGTGAGVNNTGSSVLGLGLSSAFGNTGVYINALGEGTVYFNTANHVNALGHEAGQNNTFNNVNLFGHQAIANENGQTVLSKDGTIMALISTTELTDTRKYKLPDDSGTLALTSNIPTLTYQVYTALLTQNGASNVLEFTGGNTVIGVTYEIYEAASGAAGFDFTNVGAPDNNVGTKFVATGTTPNSWGNNNIGLRYNEGAPVATVLENTIGNIWFTYNVTGQYGCHSNNLFITDKTTIDTDAYGQNANFGALISTSTIFPTNKFSIFTYKSFPDDDILINNRIEIRVYN